MASSLISSSLSGIAVNRLGPSETIFSFRPQSGQSMMRLMKDRSRMRSVVEQCGQGNCEICMTAAAVSEKRAEPVSPRTAGPMFSVCPLPFRRPAATLLPHWMAAVFPVIVLIVHRAIVHRDRAVSGSHRKRLLPFHLREFLGGDDKRFPLFIHHNHHAFVLFDDFMDGP